MTDSVQEIKGRLDLAEFLRGYFPLKPAGKNFKANCPFHKEKTPSFMVSPERQSWKCFGCGEGGDIFTFLMKFENIEFIEALRMLAEKAGVELRRANPAAYKESGVLYDINEAAKNFFKHLLRNSAPAYDYFKRRGLKDQTIEEFELGFASHLYDELTVSLINLGYNVNDLTRAGVTFKNEKGLYMDRFRNRLMFPIHNHFGKVAGFTGRILPQYENSDAGKYVNSPETPLFNKSRLLYGWHKTKNEIRDKKEAVLVEGQMDFLMAWQDGVKNVVATSGTALTAEHLKTLRKFSDKIILNFDSDSAGRLAAERSIDLASAIDFEVYLVDAGGDFKDPAETAQKQPGLLAELVKKAIPAMNYYFKEYLAGFESANIFERKHKIRLVLAKLKNIASSVEQSHWLKELADRTSIEEKVLSEEMEEIDVNPNSQISNLKQIPNSKFQIPNSRIELIAERLLGLAFAARQLPYIKEAVEYFPENIRLAYNYFINPSESQASKELVDAIHLRAGFEFDDVAPEKIKAEMQELLSNLKREHLKEKQKGISELVKKLTIEGKEIELATALTELDNISKKMHNL